MTRTIPGRRSLSVAAFLSALVAMGAEPPPTVAIRSHPLDARQAAPARPGSGYPTPGPANDSGGWWIGTAGIAAALAAFGGVVAASRRFLPARESAGSLRVVGRVALSAKQAVYLVRAGDRVLILGAGPQGPPSLLGELADAADPARPAAQSPVIVPASPARGFDRRIGDDE